MELFGSGIEALTYIKNLPQSELDYLIKAKIKAQKAKSAEQIAGEALKKSM